mgnify:CR=1 FL=1
MSSCVTLSIAPRLIETRVVFELTTAFLCVLIKFGLIETRVVFESG